MHPATSVILFTTASGAGYGILILLPVLTAYGVVPIERWLGIALLLPALLLITIGLLASTFHLGHPERAWRAFSQWRSSWLSREGIMSLLAYPPAMIYAYAWIVIENTDGIWFWAGIMAALISLGTLITTSMIYRSLKPIPAWATNWTIASYVILALLTGLAIIAAVVLGFGLHPARFQALALLLILAATVIKNIYWYRQIHVWETVNASAAIGSEGSTFRSVEWPHTEANYVMKEMGYQIARKHADKLRTLTRTLLLGSPFVTLVLLPSLLPMPILSVFIVLGTLLTLTGVVIERWLFFAEAKHLVTLYYGNK